MAILARAAALDAESRDFVNFCYNAINAAGQPVALDDLLDPAVTRRHVVSRAFFHLLAMASEGHLAVEQERAYADIKVAAGPRTAWAAA